MTGPERTFDWDEAESLRAKGLSLRAIAERLGVAHTKILRATDPTSRARANGKCETCTHWKDESPYGRDSDHDRGFGVCQLIQLSWDRSDRDSNALAFVEDGSGYLAYLRCKANFGCALHEAKR